VRTLPILVLLLSSALSPLALALPDELEVRLDETNKAGQFEFDAISNYTASGPRQPSEDGLRPSFHVLQLSPSLSYGITANTQVGLQLFSSLGPDGGARVDGARVELLSIPIRPDDEDDDGLFLGYLVEAGHLPATLSSNRLDAEIKMIVGYRMGRWTFASNPEIGVKVAGDGDAQPEFAVKFKVAYRVDPGYSIGVEHYGDLGRYHHLGPLNQQSQQSFAVVDFRAAGFDLNLGIGRGWNDFSERWVLKGVLSFPIGQ